MNCSCRQALSLRRSAVSANRLRYHVVVKAWRCNLGLVVLVSREACLGHPRPLSVKALVYRGCPCRDPPVCHRVQEDPAAERQPCACGWCVSCHLVSACERVCELAVIPQTNCDSRVLWNVGILTILLDDKRCFASSLSFPTVPLLYSK